MRIRLQVGVSSIFAIIAIAIVGVTVAVMYFSNRNLALETGEAELESARENTVARFFNVIVPVGQLVQSTAILTSQFPQGAVTERGAAVLAQQIMDLPQVYSVFIALDEDGEFYQVVRLPETLETFGPNGSPVPAGAKLVHRTIDTSDYGRSENYTYFANWGDSIRREHGTTDYDPRGRPWYMGAMERPGMFVTRMYRFQSTGQYGTTFAIRIEDENGKPIGVVGADITMDQIVEIMNQIRIGRHGRVFLLDRADKLIGYVGARASQDVSRFIPGKDEDIQDIKEPIVSQAVTEWVADKPLFYRFKSKVDGKRYLASAAPIPEIHGIYPTLGFVVPESEFVGAINETTSRVVELSAVILVAAIVIIILVSRILSRQLVEATREATRIGRLELDQPFDLKSLVLEVDHLGGALKGMRSALQTFLKYAPKDLVTEIVQSGKSAEIGGQRQEITLMFTDIAGFTAMSEKLPPEDVMSYMTIYFEVLTEAINGNEGTIDKFIGDAIMAMWNAPSANPEHANDACMAALAACKASNDLNRELAANNIPELKTRFGLHTCEALVGNVGAPDRMQYTSLGAGVNLASRIEGLNKFFGTQILVSDTVRRKTGARYLFRRIDTVRAKGTTQPVTIYELLGVRDKDSPYSAGSDAAKHASQYEQAFDFYLHKDFDDAAQVLERLATELPQDVVISRLLEKCRAYAAEPPPPDWSGVTNLDEK